MKRFISMLLVITLTFTSSFAFAERNWKLPKDVKDIAAEAFAGNTAVDVIDIPFGAETIGSRTFANSGVRKIYIPSTVTQIAEDAFDGTNVTISSPSSSYSQSYAEEKGLPWEDCGTHYRKENFDSVMDLINNPVAEDIYMELYELLSTEGITDPVELEYRNEYNEIVSEANVLIADFNDAVDHGKSVVDELDDSMFSFEYSSTESSNTFAFGECKFVVDTSIPMDIEITDTYLSEDGNYVILSSDEGEYYTWMLGDTMHISASPTYKSKFEVINKGDDANSFAQWLDKHENWLIALQGAHLALEKEIDRLDVKAENAVKAQEEATDISKTWAKYSDVWKKTYEKDIIKLKEAKQKKFLVKCLKHADVGLMILDAFDLIFDGRQSLKISDHNHPNEEDVTEEAKIISEDLNGRLEEYWKLYKIELYALLSEIALDIGARYCVVSTAGAASSIAAIIYAGKWLVFGSSIYVTKKANRVFNEVDELDILLHTKVVGNVYDADTLQPLQYVSVFSEKASAWTDKNGYYEIYLGPGTHTLRYNRDYYWGAERKVTLNKNEKTNEPIHLKREGETPTASPTITPTPTQDDVPTVGPQETPASLGYYAWQDENGNYVAKVTDYYTSWHICRVPSVVENWLQDNNGNTGKHKCSVVGIGSYAFSGEDTRALQYISLPDTLIWIEDDAFSDCRGNVTTITIPNGVRSIGKRAFCGFNSLTTIDLPEGITEIKANTFSWCKNLTSVQLSAGLLSIGEFAFTDCVSLKNITLPNSVTTIEKRVFEGCESLTAMNIPNSVTSLDTLCMFRNCSSLSSVTLPENLTYIGYNAFENCESLTSIIIPDNVTKIEWDAFDGCTNLKKVYVGTQYVADYFASKIPEIEIIWN